MKTFVLLFLTGLLAGCGTLAPKPVISAKPSFDTTPDATGNFQNSGLLGFTNDFAIITGGGRERYNGLIEKWGLRFIPHLKPDDGLIGYSLPAGTNSWGAKMEVEAWLMDKDHLDKFATMLRWQRQPPQ